MFHQIKEAESDMKRILTIFIFGCALLAVPFTVFAAQGEVITASDLRQTFDANPTVTREQFLGKTIQIKGVVVSTGISRYMTPYVELSERQGSPVLALCVLPRLDAGKLSSFTPGQTVTMSGRVQALSEKRILLKESTSVK